MQAREECGYAERQQNKKDTAPVGGEIESGGDYRLWNPRDCGSDVIVGKAQGDRNSAWRVVKKPAHFANLIHPTNITQSIRHAAREQDLGKPSPRPLCTSSSRTRPVKGADGMLLDYPSEKSSQPLH